MDAERAHLEDWGLFSCNTKKEPAMWSEGGQYSCRGNGTGRRSGGNEPGAVQDPGKPLRLEHGRRGRPSRRGGRDNEGRSERALRTKGRSSDLILGTVGLSEKFGKGE